MLLSVLETFQFESARRADYPFALTFFINGTVYNRLSVCCESRCNGSMRIGGKHGMFGISKIEKQKPCRRYGILKNPFPHGIVSIQYFSRCRYEQRMKMLLEQEERSSVCLNNNQVVSYTMLCLEIYKISFSYYHRKTEIKY